MQHQQQPTSQMSYNNVRCNSKGTPSPTTLSRAASELEGLRSVPKHNSAGFPVACLRLLCSLPGNSKCVDCNSPNPDWASVTYGCLICMQCSGKHRSYGVNVSFVRSVHMDAWSQEQVLAMLEGGNAQWLSFLDRHEMGNSASSAVRTKRYHTKAALFYRSHLKKHVQAVALAGPYLGREASRRIAAATTTKQQERSDESSLRQANASVERKAPVRQSSPSSVTDAVQSIQREKGQSERQPDEERVYKSYCGDLVSSERRSITPRRSLSVHM